MRPHGELAVGGGRHARLLFENTGEICYKIRCKIRYKIKHLKIANNRSYKKKIDNLFIRPVVV